ncbi:unnamed protein product (macronuclear) [Paramecium tetraurelia]|uniref:Uncharacterized protein n=1 Tax=Paramecium tetraurelia TaxID=5888 RepID=A0DBU7_PARTE|nr:uncharacterized protein GSPATT00015391001 [Paramecium tetraurelia]CAK80514.1 unnamed protein product [Paramecium tetraurelia]|eukprot:XP_001447911.1 hypothetical protein (macronuclear) [Paramecium tetraurelia strain d4-2]
MKQVIFLVMLITLSLQTSLQSKVDVVMAQMDKMALKNEFSKQLAGLIELKMLQSSYVEEVLKEIKGIRDQLISDQTIEDQEFAKKIGQLNVEIEILEIQTEKLAKELQRLNQQIADLNEDISKLIGTQQSQEKQLSTLNSKEEDIRNQYKLEIENISQRTTNNIKSIDGLNEMIAKLQQAVFAEQSKTTVLSMLINLLTLWDQIILLQHLFLQLPSLMFPLLLELFNCLKIFEIQEERINAGANEYVAKVTQSYEVTLKEVTEVRERLSADYSRTIVTLKRRNEENALSTKSRNQIQKDLPIALDLLQQYRNEREIVQSNYNLRSAKRENEVKIITQAYTIVAQQVKV